MRTQKMLAVCVLSVAVASAQAKVAPSYVAKGEGYALWLPGRPTAGTRKINVPGAGAVTARFISLKTPQVVYAVVPTAIPKSATDASPREVLSGIQEGFRRSAGGRVLSSKSIKLGRYVGRDVVITMGARPGAPVMRGRFFVTSGRTFQVMAITTKPPGAAAKAQIQKVLDSFQILV